LISRESGLPRNRAPLATDVVSAIPFLPPFCDPDDSGRDHDRGIAMSEKMGFCLAGTALVPQGFPG
jgi:hypothetical protein